jgi:hypothetical protein
MNFDLKERSLDRQQSGMYEMLVHKGRKGSLCRRQCRKQAAVLTVQTMDTLQVLKKFRKQFGEQL